MSTARHTVHCATLRDGHYFSGLPKNIIIKAMEEIWGSRAWCGHNGLGTPGECYLPVPLFSEIWLLLWHDWDNHPLSQEDEVWAKRTQLDEELLILRPKADFWWSAGNGLTMKQGQRVSLLCLCICAGCHFECVALVWQPSVGQNDLRVDLLHISVKRSRLSVSFTNTHLERRFTAVCVGTNGQTSTSIHSVNIQSICNLVSSVVIQVNTWHEGSEMMFPPDDFFLLVQHLRTEL